KWTRSTSTTSSLGLAGSSFRTCRAMGRTAGSRLPGWRSGCRCVLTWQMRRDTLTRQSTNLSS
ncbi:unnamed protein product, partial [Amoebophrya sp. A25]